MLVYNDSWEIDKEYDCPVYEKMKKMLYSAKCRARYKGLEFNLDLEHMAKLYIEICPILNIEICWTNKDKVAHGSPSLDRINNTKGYIKGNVQVISHRANTLKKDYLLAEWEKMTKYMQSGAGKIVITEQHYKTPSEELMPERLIREIKKARKKGESLEEIAYDLDLPFNLICRYAIQLEETFTN